MSNLRILAKHLQGRHNQSSHGRRGGSGGGGSTGAAISSSGRSSQVADRLQAHFGGSRRPHADKTSVTLGTGRDLASIRSELENIGMTQIKKPDYAQGFDDSWWKFGKKRVRLLKGNAMRGGEQDRSLLVSS